MDATPDLAAIRRDIDTLDAKLRALLKARAQLVTQVAASKAQNADLSRLRPVREAQQMRELIDWHSQEAPELPLPGVIAIWREIIGMALAQQGGLTIYASLAAMAMARAHFGASLDYVSCTKADEVIGKAGETGTAVGVLTIDEAHAPQGKAAVFARLPLMASAPTSAPVLAPALAPAFCYGVVSETPDEDALFLVERPTMIDGDTMIRDGDTTVLVETKTPGDDAVWGCYRRMGAAS